MLTEAACCAWIGVGAAAKLAIVAIAAALKYKLFLVIPSSSNDFVDSRPLMTPALGGARPSHLLLRLFKSLSLSKSGRDARAP
jgi:hypothetical protein